MKKIVVVTAFLFLFAPSSKADELTFRMLIQFGLNSSKVDAKYDEQLKWMAQFMEKYPNSTVTIHGHADSTGNKAKNLKLSKDRAKSVRRTLITRHGVAAERLTAEGHGDSQPGSGAKTREAQAASRRVTMAVAKDAPGAFKGLKKEIVIYGTPSVTFEDPKYVEAPAKIVSAPAPEAVREVAATEIKTVVAPAGDRSRERCPLAQRTCANQFEVGVFAAHHIERVTQFKSGSVISVGLGWNPQWYRSNAVTLGTRLGGLLLHDQDGGSFIAIETGAIFGYDLSEKWRAIAGPLAGYWTQSEVAGISPGATVGLEWYLGLDSALPKIGVEYTYFRQAVADAHFMRFNFGVAL